MLPCECVPTSKRDVLLGRMDALKRAIERIAPDVIHSSCAMPDIAVSRLFPEIQLVTVHSDFKTNYSYIYGPIPGRFLAWLHMAAVRKAKAAAAVSESLSKTYEREYFFPLPFIRNGVSVEKEENADRLSLRRQLGLPEERTIFVYAATFSRLKNQAFLAESFERRSQRAPLLLLLGDGATYPALREKYANAKNVRMPGRVSNVRDYLRASDYYLSASRSEGVSLAVLEAMAERLPVLLSDIPPHREIVELSGNCGELFRLDDEASFAEAMQRLFRADYAAAAERARLAAEQYFNAAVMSREYQSMYRDI